MEPELPPVDRPRPRCIAAAMQIDGREIVAIFAGGFIGAVGRSALEQIIATPPDHWPWATFAVNMLAALLLGFVATSLHGREPAPHYRRAFLAIGICGALSTFSTMMLELLRMIDAGDWTLALGYTAASLAGGYAAVVLASGLVRRARAGT